MNKKIQLQDLRNKDYKETWDYQEELFKGIVDTKIQNRREETNLETTNYFFFVFNFLPYFLYPTTQENLKPKKINSNSPE